MDQLKFVPGLQRFVEGASLDEQPGQSPIRSASDFSYSASQYSGDHFRLAGDAAGEFNPLISLGFFVRSLRILF